MILDVNAILPRAELFQGIAPEDLPGLLEYLRARTEVFYKNEVFYRGGDERAEFCYLLSGRAMAFQYDYWGNRSVLAELGADSILFGSLAAGDGTEMDAVALGPCTVLVMSEKAYHLIPRLSQQQAFNRFNANLVRLLSRMYAQMLERNHILGQRTIRKKLMAYLSQQAMLAQSPHFTVPLSRQELADYLYVDRYALSHELGRMQEEGLLRFRRGVFTLAEITVPAPGKLPQNAADPGKKR